MNKIAKFGFPILLLLISTILCGCVSQSQYQLLQDNYDTLLAQQEATLQGLSETQTELMIIKNTCPPHDFLTRLQLQNWVDAHIQTNKEYAEPTFTDVIKVQQMALDDGFLVSINIYFDEAAQLYYIGCQAFAGNILYWWHPSNNTLFPWTDFSK